LLNVKIAASAPKIFRANLRKLKILGADALSENWDDDKDKWEKDKKTK